MIAKVKQMKLQGGILALTVLSLLILIAGAENGVLRNVSSLGYLYFVSDPGAKSLPSLAASADALAAYLSNRSRGYDEVMVDRYAMVQERVARYSNVSAEAEQMENTADSGQVGVLTPECREQRQLAMFDVPEFAAEWPNVFPLTLVWEFPPSSESDPSAKVSHDEANEECPTRLQQVINTRNLGWSGEDLREFRFTSLFGFSSGSRSEELDDKVVNQVETVERNGRTATVYTMENLEEVDNVLISPRIYVTGGEDYFLSAKLKTMSGNPNAWFGLECRSKGQPDSSHYQYIARSASITEWKTFSGLVSTQPGDEVCGILMLNYGASEKVYFDDIILALVSKEEQP